MAPFVILDRDGVINEDSPEYIKSAEEWLPIDGSIKAIAALTRCGVDVYVATNQAGIARGKLTLTSLISIHRKMDNAVESAGGKIKDLRFCPHHPREGCGCRKPEPGMLIDLAETHNLDLSEGYFVGDSKKDLEAAARAGCTGVLVLTGNGRSTLAALPDYSPVFPDLATFASNLLTHHP